MPAQPDPPEYPTEWTPEQRVTAYWYANGRNITANSTTSWHRILNAAERTAERRRNKTAAILATVNDEEAPF